MKYLSFVISILMFQLSSAQTVLLPQENYNVTVAHGTKLGVTDKVTNLVEKDLTSREKRNANKLLKAAPDNFKGRRGQSKAIYPELEHQGEDKLWQKDFGNSARLKTFNEPIINIDGISSTFGSPNDPSGDVSDRHYVQGINATEIGVFNLDGSLEARFAANTLWTSFNVISAGDPIILYDEQSDRWIITEFTDPANLLIAVTETDDPLGSYHVYNFPTPRFPDYPKYALSPDALILTTNEGGAATLHQYFFDLKALIAGEDNVTMQRIEVGGNTDIESGFFVTTPVDWNGENMPYDNNPITIRVNDSSWAGGSDQDQIEIYTFDVDFINEDSTRVIQSSVVVSPFDTYPCSTSAGGVFACIPQLGGGGLEGLPDIISNLPHLRNFGTHESMVFSFATDVTDGDNLAGIRWIELRRTAGSEWSLYQEGTYAPDDGLHRFIGSIAIDDNGNIGLGYNVSSENDYVGLRYTGRLASDPLGIMTIDEVNVVDGVTPINSGSRLGDYSQMSVSPFGDNTFWFTGEYAGNENVRNSLTRIFAFKIEQDSNDLSVSKILSPVTSPLLSDQDIVSIEVSNNGINEIQSYDIGLIVDNQFVESKTISTPIASGEQVIHSFDSPQDFSEFTNYSIETYVTAEVDDNNSNDTLSVEVSKIRQVDGLITSQFLRQSCTENAINLSITITNEGADTISRTAIEVAYRGDIIDTLVSNVVLAYTDEVTFEYSINSDFLAEENDMSFTIIDINDGGLDDNPLNDVSLVTAPFDFNLMPINLIIRADRFPAETSWEFREQGSADLIASGAINPDVRFGINTIPLCVSPDKCYVITVLDSYGDGICCGAGNGSFSVEDTEGNVFVSNNGQFGFSVDELFCAEMVGCNLSAAIDVTNASWAGGDNGVIMITAANGVGDYLYSIDGGISFESDNVFADLPAGDYSVVVTDAEGRCTYEESVNVSFSTSTTDISQGVLTVKPNPTDGVIQVSLPTDNNSEPFIVFQILDIKGQLLQSRKIGIYDDAYTGAISLYNYPDGHYILRYVSKSMSGIVRVIKN